MRLVSLTSVLLVLNASLGLSSSLQIPLVSHNASDDRAVSARLFGELEELSRIVDIAYCVGLTNTGISKPFGCLSRCSDFPDFELVKSWNTGPLMSDSCGYIALDHSLSNSRIIVAFRGTYSIANAVVDLSTIPQEYVPYPADPEVAQRPGEHSEGPKCNNCTVHMGFFESWRVTSKTIKPDMEALVAAHPAYSLHLVGHSLGGAVAALAGMEYLSKGWNPTVTTFGEPRLGNKGLMTYIDAMFNLTTRYPTSGLDSVSLQSYEDSLRFRRVTHIDDPVPQLPLSEWGFRMHAGEIFITKQQLSPNIEDMQHCFGDEDPLCIAGQDGSLAVLPQGAKNSALGVAENDRISRQSIADVVKEAALWGSSGGSITIPARYRLWQLLFAHRDYFWRLGLCVPGSPWNWGQSAQSAVDMDEHDLEA